MLARFLAAGSWAQQSAISSAAVVSVSLSLQPNPAGRAQQPSVPTRLQQVAVAVGDGQGRHGRPRPVAHKDVLAEGRVCGWWGQTAACCGWLCMRTCHKIVTPRQLHALCSWVRSMRESSLSFVMRALFQQLTSVDQGLPLLVCRLDALHKVPLVNRQPRARKILHSGVEGRGRAERGRVGPFPCGLLGCAHPAMPHKGTMRAALERQLGSRQRAWRRCLTTSAALDWLPTASSQHPPGRPIACKARHSTRWWSTGVPSV